MPGPIVLPAFPADKEFQPKTHCGLVKPFCHALKFKCRLCHFYLPTKYCKKTCQKYDQYCGSNECSISTPSEPSADISDNGENN